MKYFIEEAVVDKWVESDEGGSGRRRWGRAEGPAQEVRVVPEAGNGEVSQPALLFVDEAFAEECLGESVFDLSVDIMYEHIGLSTLLVPAHHPSGVDGTHPPRCILVVAGGCVDHDQIPLCLVHHTGQTLQSKLANGVSGVSHCCALLSSPNLHQILSLLHLAVVPHVVRLHRRKPPPYLLHPCLVFFQEHRPPTMIQCTPHEAVVPQPKHQKVARGFLLQHSCRHRYLFQRLLWGDG